MKISAQVAQMMQVQDTKTLGGQALVELFALLKEGDLKANVAQIVGKLLTLEILGENMTLQLSVDDKALQSLSVGSDVKLMLSDQGKIILEAQPSALNASENQTPLPTTAVLDTHIETKQSGVQTLKSDLDNMVSSMVLKHNLQNDPMTRELLSILLKNELPVSGELIKEMKHSLQALNLVSHALTENTLPVVAEKMQLDLKQLAVQLIGQPEVASSSVQGPVVKFEGTSLEPIIFAIFSESQSEGHLVRSELDSFKALLLDLKPEQLSLILGSKENITFKDVVLLMNQFNGIWSEQESFDKISNVLKTVSLSSKDLVDFFAVLVSPKKPDEKIEALDKWLMTLKLSPSEEKSLKSEMIFLKDTLALSSKNVDDIYVFQMPIKMNQEQNHVEFFIKRNKRKKEMQEAFQIYLTLSTKNFEKVSCLVTGTQSDVFLKFGLENKAFMNMFSKQEAVLSGLLSSVTSKKVKISFEEREEVALNFFKSENTSFVPTGIDIRV